MLLKLLLLMTIVPTVELWLLFQISDRIGGIETLWLIILTGIIGASLAKREGLSVISKIQEDAVNGEPPGDRLAEGLLVLVGGILLLTPGVVTDLTGLLMIFPLSRRPLSQVAKRWLTARVQFSGVDIGAAAAGPAAQRTREALNQNEDGTPGDDRFDHPVL